MFYGEYEHTIDRKGRLILPSKFREVAKGNFIEKFYITRGLDKCLFMFAEEEWRTQEQKFKSVSFTKQESRVFNRIFFSGAMEIIPDRQRSFALYGTRGNRSPSNAITSSRCMGNCCYRVGTADRKCAIRNRIEGSRGYSQ